MIDKYARYARDGIERSEGWLLGVCAGIANSWDISVAVVRVVGLVALFWFPQLTVTAYLLLWLLVYRTSNQRSTESASESL